MTPHVKIRTKFARKHALTFALALGAATIACGSDAHARRWKATHSTDKFTDVEYCRVEPGSTFSRGLLRSMAGAAITLHFFAERRGTEIRVGVVSEPLLPIGGDVQIRVDQNPVQTITAADTPIDAGPRFAMPPIPNLTEEARQDYERAMTAAMASASPFKAYTGERAVSLIGEILAGKKVLMRTIGINAALSTTVEFEVHQDLRRALAECGIAPSTPNKATVDPSAEQ